ncbi:MAG: lysophospholipid acyltransferase family protein [Lysobacterales bacterium]
MTSIFASIVRFVLRSLLLTGFMLVFLTPSLLLVSYHRRDGTQEGSRKADRVAIRLAQRLAWLFGLRVKVVGEPQSGAVLIVANHISWLDIPVLHSACAVGFVSKAEVDSWPVFRHIARAGSTIFHQRGNHDSAAGVSSLMAQRLQQDRAVAIFPEGGIKPGAPIRVFHARMFRPAVDAGCEVQPVTIRYMRDGRIDEEVAFRVGESMLINFYRQLARPKSIAEVHFLPTISAVDQPRRFLADSARAAVVSCYES